MTGPTTPPRAAEALDVDRYREWTAAGVLWDFKPGDDVVVPDTDRTGRLFATMQRPDEPALEVSIVPDDDPTDILRLPATAVRCTRCGTLGGHLWQWLQHPNPPARRRWWHLLTRSTKGPTR